MRKKLITRTITATKAIVLCMNVTTCEPTNEIVIVSGKWSDKGKLLTAVKNMIETDEVKAVHIVGTEEIEELYGMAEQDFLKYAKKMEKRGHLPEEEEEFDEEETAQSAEVE